MLDALTLDQLRVFVAVVDTGSFSGASRRLARVQSAISHSVQGLEAALGVKLFERSGRLPELTEPGEALLADARALLRSVSSLQSRAAGFADGVEPELAIAVDPLFPITTLIEAIRAVEQQFPGMAIRLVTGVIGEPERCLRAGEVSLAIYTHDPLRSKDLEVQFLTRVKLIPVVAASHALARISGPVLREQLAEYTQLAVSTGDSGGWSSNIMSPRIWRFADLYTRREFLLAGLGWCYMPECMVAEAICGGQLKRLAVQEKAEDFFPLYAVHLQATRLGPGGRALLQKLMQGSNE